MSHLPTDQLSPFLSESFSTSDYLHHILQAFTLGGANTSGEKNANAPNILPVNAPSSSSVNSNSATNAPSGQMNGSSSGSAQQSHASGPSLDLLASSSSSSSSTQYALSLTSSALHKLSQSLSHTNTQIQHHLSSSWGVLTNRIAQIDELREAHANLMREFQAMERIMHERRHFNSDEYRELETKIVEAHRLYAIVSTLRLVSRLLEWIREIDDGDLLRRDRVRCTKLVMNVLELYDERHELHGIHVVQESVQRVKRLQEQLKKEAQEQLMNALKQRQHMGISEALQIFYEMRTLRAEVTSLVAHAIQDTKTVLQNGLDPAKGDDITDSSSSFTQRFARHRSGRTSSGGGNPTGSSSSFDMFSNEAKTEYLFRVKEMFSNIHSLYMDIWHLNHMLRKKKCPDTQLSYEQIVIREEISRESVLENYWSSMTRIVTQEILTAINNIQFVKTIFTQEYPQILELFTEFAHKFTSYTEFLSRSGSSTLTPSQWITDSMKDIQQEFLIKCVTRLNERINGIFTRVRPPKNLADDNFSYMSMVDVRNFGNAVIMELHETKKSTTLLHQLSKRITSVLKQFSVQCETILIHNEAAFSVNIYKLPNIFQKFNAQIFNGLCTICSLISEIVPEYNQHPSVQKDLQSPLVTAKEQARDIVTPVFASIQKKMEDILLSLHLESYTSADSSEVSSYVKQLEQSLTFVCKEHLKLYQKDSSIVKSLSKSTAERLIQFFVRQISLLNPLQEEGRIKLANDMAQVELAVGSNLFHVEKLGTIHRQLKAFRKLLFMETDAIASSKNELVEEMDPLLIAQHLFSRVPPGADGLVLRPHQYMNVNLNAYNQFLEENNRDAVYKMLVRFVNEEKGKLQKRREEHKKASTEGEDSEEYEKWISEGKTVLATIGDVVKGEIAR
uniref:Conserved oligomeric Golgi complex subunit 5 helical domain-containing protein n=1 Tax=Percolomonas cosmopolitus TaxID=63605 RepID=A0A7S1KQ19_9EUKA